MKNDEIRSARYENAGQPRMKPLGRSTVLSRGIFASSFVLGTLLGSASLVAAQPAVGRAVPGQRMIVDRVIAVVNDSIILESELRTRLLVVLPDAAQIADPQERERRVARLTQQTLDEMVNDELMVQSAIANRIEVTPDEVDAALDEIRTSNSLDDAGLAAALAEQGFTVSGFKIDLRRQLLRLRAISKLVTPRVTIAEGQIRAAFDQETRRSESVSQVRLSQMLFRIPQNPTESQVTEARAKATAAMARVQAGEAFADVAAAVSEDEVTKAGGGELGWFSRGNLPPELEQIVFAMDKGELRGPIAGADGLLVITALDVKQKEPKVYEKERDRIAGVLRRRETDKQTSLWLEQLRKDAFLDIKVAGAAEAGATTGTSPNPELPTAKPAAR